MKPMPTSDDCLLVDISDALSERDRVRFTVQTRTRLPHFSKQTISVVRQHEEFIWLHDCLEENEDYAGYIIPPGPPKPDFDASREKLQRLGDGEAHMSKKDFAKMKHELEVEYLAIFKKTVAMHEMFLQRLAAHAKFKYDSNFKIFLEYENELSVRSKSKKEKFSGFIQNIGRSAHDLVLTTSQVAASSSATSLLIGQPSKTWEQKHQLESNTSPIVTDISQQSANTNFNVRPSSTIADLKLNDNQRQGGNQDLSNSIAIESEEQYFQRERLMLSMYYKSIKDAALNSNKVTQAQKGVADSYLQISQQLVKLSAIEILPITKETKDTSNYIACLMPSLTLPEMLREDQHKQIDSSIVDSSKNLNEFTNSNDNNIIDTSSKQDNVKDKVGNNNSTTKSQIVTSVGNGKISNNDDENGYENNTCDDDDDDDEARNKSSRKLINIDRDIQSQRNHCAKINKTSDGLKQFLLCIADFLEQSRKIEARIASDEDLKITDTFVYYKNDTSAATDLISRRQRFMAEYVNATKNYEKYRQTGKTSNMQYFDVIHQRAKENFISISKQAKSEISDYKERRVASMKKSFVDLVELELKHLKSYSQLIRNCLSNCQQGFGKVPQADQSVTETHPTLTTNASLPMHGNRMSDVQASDGQQQQQQQPTTSTNIASN